MLKNMNNWGWLLGFMEINDSLGHNADSDDGKMMNVRRVKH